jgi:hypothetical protein
MPDLTGKHNTSQCLLLKSKVMKYDTVTILFQQLYAVHGILFHYSLILMWSLVENVMEELSLENEADECSLQDQYTKNVCYKLEVVSIAAE